jgi:hypothetical protein
MEEWRDIPGYEGYQASSSGKIKGKQGKELSLNTTSQQGYIQLSLFIQGKPKFGLVHRLVALAFKPNPFNYRIVNHLDGDVKNNRSDNLEWCSQSQNMKHAIDTGLIKRTSNLKKSTKLSDDYEYISSEWKYIEGYGRYKISIRGEIISVRKGIAYLLQTPPDFYGYTRVNLSKDGIVKTHFIHRLVAKHFISNPEDKSCVNHKDGNKSNNSVENLEWVSVAENMLYYHKSNRHPNSKISRENREEIFRRYTGRNSLQLSVEYGVSKQYILNLACLQRKKLRS